MDFKKILEFKNIRLFEKQDRFLLSLRARNIQYKCLKCADALIELENSCLACEEALDKSKSITTQEWDELEQDIKIEENGQDQKMKK